MKVGDLVVVDWSGHAYHGDIVCIKHIKNPSGYIVIDKPPKIGTGYTIDGKQWCSMHPINFKPLFDEEGITEENEE